MTDTPASDATVAVPQIAVDDLAVERNADRIRDRVAALPDRVDIAVFPEYALTGFVADDRIAEAALTRDRAVDRLSAVAEDHGVSVVAGYAERGGDGDSGELYNAAAYVPARGSSEAGPDERESAVYRKRHLWGDESDLVTAGTERVIADTPAGSTGLLTCYDLNFVAESAWFAERAVDALFVLGAWPAAHAANWRLLLRARALDGVRWAVGAGRTGAGRSRDEPAERDAEGRSTREYAGNSLVVRPDGRVGDELDRGERDLIATLDRETLNMQRELVGAVDRE